MLNFRIFKKHKNIKYAFSTKADGEMPRTNDSRPTTKQKLNLKRYLKKHKIKAPSFIFAGINHSANARVVNIKYRKRTILKTDAIITKSKNVFLAATFADCFPVYFYDPARKIIGLAHAGWRGITKGIAGSSIEAMKKIGSFTHNIKVGIGPGIQAHHFEIKKDILPKFKRYKRQILRRKDKIFVDLPGIMKEQMTVAGIKPKNIENCKICTYCERRKYFSFRRDKPKNIKAMIGHIGVM